jgi:hypothetical protein
VLSAGLELKDGLRKRLCIGNMKISGHGGIYEKIRCELETCEMKWL